MAKTKSRPSAKSKSLSIPLDELKEAANTLRALNHKVRQQILNLIHASGEITVSEIYAKLKLEQSLTSSYLAILRKGKIVKPRREGQSIHYSINHDHIAQIEKGAKTINGH